MGSKIKIIFLAFITISIILQTTMHPTWHIKTSEATKNTNTSIFPQLFAIKVVDKSEVILGKEVIVTITIENIGNKTAYNISISDSIPKAWIFNVTGYTNLSYTQIDPGAIRQFSYSLTANKLSIIDDEGNYIPYILRGAVINYYDSEINPSKYVHSTNNVKITVIEAPEDFSLSNFNSEITLLLILIIFNIFLFLRLVSSKLNRRSSQIS